MSSIDWLGYAGKRVVVSGCFSGIGEAAARQLIEAGAEVHGLDRRPSELALASFTTTDLRDPASIESSVAGLRGEYDALFNCAGVPPGPPPIDVMKVNYLGTRHLTQCLQSQLRPGGAIANIASTGGMGWSSRLSPLKELAGVAAFSDGALWCADHLETVAEGYRFSKEAVIVWTMLASAETIKRGVRMNCTLPGAVQTPMLVEIEKGTPTAVIDQIAQPIGRRSDADEQAAVLLFLNSAKASYVNGAVLPADGGFMATTAMRGS